MGWENKHRASSQSCRYRKMIISTLAGKRFEKGKETAISSFKEVIIQRNNPQQPAIDLTKNVENIKEQGASRPNENTKTNIDIKKGVEIKKGNPTPSLY